MPLPGLHVVTDDEVLADDRFRDRALRLLDAHGPALALHLRGPGMPTRRLHGLAGWLAPAARAASALLLVNDRADVALAVGADGVQLGRRSMPVAAARSLRAHWVVGASVHGPEEAQDAEHADFLVLGTIWETASHPGRDGAGLGLVRAVRERVRAPVIVVGGVTPERARAAREAGAAGVAAIRGIWMTADPAGSAAEYLAAMATASTTERVGERP